MPVLRLNAEEHGLAVHRSPACADAALRRAAQGAGPIIVMTHGFKYQPGLTQHCPHDSIFSLNAPHGWPRHLGFGLGRSEEGLALAYGWQARGLLWQVQRRARRAGQQLAEAITTLRRAAPHRPIHLITHSMGSEVALEALHHLAPNDIARVISLTAASYQSRAIEALATPAGRRAELLNITSGENDLFDFAFERLIAPPCPGDRALGAGLDLPNAVSIQIDCARTLAAMSRLGAPVAPPSRRVCHWSAYTRPGLLRFYRIALREPARTPLSELLRALPATRDRRFARLLPRIPVSQGLPYWTQRAS
ncbi:MAG: DUF726 domain-containing protein [Pseudomonadota bacterium]